jgi:hypothetical protein
MVGVGLRSLARVLALEVVAASPTVLVLLAGWRAPGILLFAAACLGAGYLLLRLPGSKPVEEGAWLGLAIGGGLGLAYAMTTNAVLANLCAGGACNIDPMDWMRGWLMALVACSGIGLALGFVARYDMHHRLVRSARPTPTLAGQQHFARLK